MVVLHINSYRLCQENGIFSEAIPVVFAVSLRETSPKKIIEAAAINELTFVAIWMWRKWQFPAEKARELRSEIMLRFMWNAIIILRTGYLKRK